MGRRSRNEFTTDESKIEWLLGQFKYIDNDDALIVQPGFIFEELRSELRAVGIYEIEDENQYCNSRTYVKCCEGGGHENVK